MKRDLLVNIESSTPDLATFEVRPPHSCSNSFDDQARGQQRTAADRAVGTQDTGRRLKRGKESGSFLL